MSFRTRFGVVSELLSYFAQKKRWALPLVVLLLLLSIFIIAAESSALGPFIYALF